MPTGGALEYNDIARDSALLLRFGYGAGNRQVTVLGRKV